MEEKMAKKQTAEAWMRSLDTQGFTDMAAVMTHFVGQTVQSIKVARTTKLLGGKEKATGRWLVMTFTNGAGFTLDCARPLVKFRLSDEGNRKMAEAAGQVNKPNLYVQRF
jgi:hypothetical protein